MDDENRTFGPDDTLRELATRLLDFRFGSIEDEQATPRLLVGELPTGLPLALPVPEGARVLGTFVGPQTIIAIDAMLDPEAALAFYTERMTALGWSERELWGGRQGGFVHSSARSHAVANFSREDDGVVFTVMAGWAPGGHSTVQITYRPEGNGFGSRQQRHQQHRDFMSVLPAIRPPKRARQTPQGGSGGPDAVNALARLECDLDLAAVAPHYRAELERGGWQLTESGATGPVAWSTWSFRDGEGAEWSAALIVLERAGRADAAHNYALQLLAEREPEPRTEETGRIGRVTVASEIISGGWTTRRLIGQQTHDIP